LQLFPISLHRPGVGRTLQEIEPTLRITKKAAGRRPWARANIRSDIAAQPLPPNLALYHCVAPRRFAKPLRAQLRRALLRLEVDIHEAETVAEAINPFEVVLRAPVEVAIHRNAVGRRTLELCETSAQKHHPV